MKNLIVTTAIMIFVVILMGWQLELKGILHQKQRLQYAAEEAAAAVVMGELSEGEDARRKAEESLRLQMSAAGGPADPGASLSVNVLFGRADGGAPAVVVTVKQGKTSASGWYPLPRKTDE